MRNEKLGDFLSSKPLYYKEIDHERVHEAYARLKPHIKQLKTVHLVGTNGKGSTGRILAHLAALGFDKLSHRKLSVGHYTSPHIMKFNERIWIDGKNVDNTTLEKAHQKLQTLLLDRDSEALSYFEYTTFLAMLSFSDCDYVVLEAGLGGEHDATNVFPKTLSIITPIAIECNTDKNNCDQYSCDTCVKGTKICFYAPVAAFSEIKTSYYRKKCVECDDKFSEDCIEGYTCENYKCVVE